MFSNANERARRRYEAALSPALAAWREDDGSWFAGTPESVDKRIAKCRVLQSSLRAAASALAGTGRELDYIAAERELAGDRVALETLRRDLLTGAADREVVAEEVRRPAAPLTRSAERWVESQAREFAREQGDGVSREELAERAKRYAAIEVSAMDVAAPASLVQAFVARVVDLAPRRRRQASAPPPGRDFPDQLMYG